MAEQLTTPYTYTSTRGTWSKYPWTNWLNGSDWRVFEGADVKNVKQFRSYLYNVAHQRGLTVITQIENADDPNTPTCLVFRAFK